MMRKEQRRDGVARAIDRDRQLRRAQAIAAASSQATRSIASAGVSSVTSEVTSTVRGPSARSASTAASASASVAVLAAGQLLQFELVGRDDVGRRHRVQRA